MIPKPDIRNPKPGELLSRVCSHFARQIAWFDKTISDLDALEHRLDAPRLDVLLRERTAQTQDIAHMEQEFLTLAGQWQNAADIAPAERARVHALARQAEERAAELARAYQRTLNLVGRRAASVKGALQALRKDRDLMDRYHPSAPFGTSLIDKKA